MAIPILGCERFDKILHACSFEQQWLIFSALRGPDDSEDIYLKTFTTAPLRWFLGLEEWCENLGLDCWSFCDALRTWASLRIEEKANIKVRWQKSRHFKFHIKMALRTVLSPEVAPSLAVKQADEALQMQTWLKETLDAKEAPNA